MDPRRSDRVRRLGWPVRLALCAGALAIGGVLGLARWLEPDPRGYGTHTQLGLRPCAFAQMTGELCPTCGMTTAFAWTMRGQFRHAWRANPVGTLLVPVCVALLTWLVGSAFLGRPWGCQTLEQPLILLAVAIVASSLLAWTIRMLLRRVL